jgi:hypothetical protein
VLDERRERLAVDRAVREERRAERDDDAGERQVRRSRDVEA